MGFKQPDIRAAKPQQMEPWRFKQPHPKRGPSWPTWPARPPHRMDHPNPLDL